MEERYGPDSISKPKSSAFIVNSSQPTSSNKVRQLLRYLVVHNGIDADNVAFLPLVNAVNRGVSLVKSRNRTGRSGLLGKMVATSNSVPMKSC